MATRIGVFFDGTGNNMWNDEKIGDGSQSNIAKLYRLYENQGHEPIYSEGVGTEEYTQSNTFNETQIIDIKTNNNKGSYYNTFSQAFALNAKAMVEKKLDEIENAIFRLNEKFGLLKHS